MKHGAVLVAIGVGAFLGVVVVCGGMGVGFLMMVNDQMEQVGSSFTHSMNMNVSGIDYQLQGPDTVRAGEPAVFTIEVTNTDNTTRMLHSLDLYTQLVDQGSFSATPSPSSRSHQQGGQYAQLVYTRDIAPGDTEKIEVSLTPTQTGQYNVNIDACIDDEFTFIERFHDLEVEPASAGGSNNTAGGSGNLPG